MAEFPEWPHVMTTWGDKMLAAVHTVSQMAAIGFGLPAGAFTERMAHGPHLLAPTGNTGCLAALCVLYTKCQLDWLSWFAKSSTPLLPASCLHEASDIAYNSVQACSTVKRSTEYLP